MRSHWLLPLPTAARVQCHSVFLRIFQGRLPSCGSLDCLNECSPPSASSPVGYHSPGSIIRVLLFYQVPTTKKFGCPYQNEFDFHFAHSSLFSFPYYPAQQQVVE